MIEAAKEDTIETRRIISSINSGLVLVNKELAAHGKDCRYDLEMVTGFLPGVQVNRYIGGQCWVVYYSTKLDEISAFVDALLFAGAVWSDGI